MMVILSNQLDDLLCVAIQMGVVLDLSIGSHFISILELLTVEELDVVGIDSMWIDSIDLSDSLGACCLLIAGWVLRL